MTYFNAQGQGRVGWRSSVVASTPVTVSTLLTSLYSVWNAEGTLKNGVKGAYNGDNANDSSPMANHGTPTGSLTYSTGKVGNAFVGNGSNAWVSLPNNAWTPTGDFSISQWVYVISNPANATSMYQSFNIVGSPATTYGIQSWIVNNNFRFTISYGSSTTQYHTDASISSYANQWVHLTVTRKKGTNVKLYINGTLTTTQTWTQDPVYYTTSYNAIGVRNSAIAGPQYFFYNGMKIDGLTLWDVELSQAAITELYNSGNGREYPFNSASVSVDSAADIYGINNGTLMNGTTFAAGKIGKAFTFDGVNDYVALPDNIFNSLTGDFSISFWYYYGSTTSGFKTAISSYINAAGLDYGWELDISGAGAQPYFAIYGTSTVTLQRANTFIQNQWNHFVVTRKSGVGTTFYHNGSSVISNSSTVNPRYNSTMYNSIGALKFGVSSAGQFTPNGNLLDAVSVWNKELSAAEITELYNSGAGKQYPNF